MSLDLKTRLRNFEHLQRVFKEEKHDDWLYVSIINHVVATGLVTPEQGESLLDSLKEDKGGCDGEGRFYPPCLPTNPCDKCEEEESGSTTSST